MWATIIPAWIVIALWILEQLPNRTWFTLG